MRRCSAGPYRRHRGPDDREYLLLGTQQFANALTIGAIYALIALGYTMVYGIVELINFAHGDVFMVGSFVAMWIMTTIFGLTGPVTNLLNLVGSAGDRHARHDGRSWA